MIQFPDGEIDVELADVGGRYDPLLDEWSPISVVGSVFDGSGGLSAWTGHELLVYTNRSIDVVSAGRYDPELDSWTSMPLPPDLHHGGTSVWTGEAFVVWGGSPVGVGHLFDPESNEWTAISDASAPGPRNSAPSVWTGTYMFIFGGLDFQHLPQPIFDGARYDPVLDEWSAVSAPPAPPGAAALAIFWTGREILLLGGVGRPECRPFILLYDLEEDSWTEAAQAPAGACPRRPVWTGTVLLTWGSPPDLTEASGYQYDPSSDEWTRLSDVGAPSPRLQHAAVWAGDQLVVWGGHSGRGGYRNDGGRFFFPE